MREKQQKFFVERWISKQPLEDNFEERN